MLRHLTSILENDFQFSVVLQVLNGREGIRRIQFALLQQIERLCRSLGHRRAWLDTGRSGKRPMVRP